MVATINSLPPELIRLILAAACPGYKDLKDLWDRYAYLRATALVCSAWKSTSQELLWEYVELKTPKAMAAFIQAPRWPIKKLNLIYRDSEGPEPYLVPLEQILEGGNGVEALSIYDSRTMHPGRIPAVLKLDSISGEEFKGEPPRLHPILWVLITRLAGLKSIDLDGGVQLALDTPSFVPSFSLERLHIALDDIGPLPPSRLLAMLCQPSVSTLALHCPSERDSLLHDILSVAPNLHTLYLTPSSADRSFVPTFLRACSALERLELDWAREGWLEALPSPLVSLRLMKFKSGDAESLVESIKDGIVGVSKLRELHVDAEELHGLPSALSGDATEGVAAWTELAKICREKGIKTVDSMDLSNFRDMLW